MRIVVCLKQVYDPATVRVSSRAELDTRDGVLTTNAADLCALETALALKDMQAAEVIAVTLGTASAEDVVLQALALGADRAILLSDPLFAGSDAGVSVMRWREPSPGWETSTSSWPAPARGTTAADRLGRTSPSIWGGHRSHLHQMSQWPEAGQARCVPRRRATSS